jgi:Flp pilus assembly pilin Flp
MVMNSALGFAIRFVRDDRGQDLVEYGLLAAIFAIASALLFPQLVPLMTNAYSQHAVDINNAWIPGDPLP